MESYKVDWKLTDDPFADVGFALARRITKLAYEHLPELADLFPFKAAWEIKGHLGETWLAFSITDTKVAGIPSVGKFEDKELIELTDKALPFRLLNHEELVALLGRGWFSFDRFTYVGPYSPPHASWQHVHEHLLTWLDTLVIPVVLERNEKRILRAVPPPPHFDIDAILKSLWVIECEESLRQGTAFSLEGVGVVTCQHVLGPRTQAFRPEEISRKYRVSVRAADEDIDLAILDVGSVPTTELKRGSADNLSVMDHAAVAGFPNYNRGDGGVFSPGLVIGFRMRSGIRRFLINAAIVRGNSGGPVLDMDNRVIGVAVTGADQMEKAQATENHGVIPIDALKYLLQ